MVRKICFLLLFVFILCSCKKARIYRRIEGNWLFYKQLEIDGSYSQHQDIYSFSRGKLSKKNEYGLTVFSTDTIALTYKVIKSDVIQIRIQSTDSTINWTVEDMDNKTMVVRATQVVMFFEKQ